MVRIYLHSVAVRRSGQTEARILTAKGFLVSWHHNYWRAAVVAGGPAASWCGIRLFEFECDGSRAAVSGYLQIKDANLARLNVLEHDPILAAGATPVVAEDRPHLDRCHGRLAGVFNLANHQDPSAAIVNIPTVFTYLNIFDASGFVSGRAPEQLGANAGSRQEHNENNTVGQPLLSGHYRPTDFGMSGGSSITVGQYGVTSFFVSAAAPRAPAHPGDTAVFLARGKPARAATGGADRAG